MNLKLSHLQTCLCNENKRQSRRIKYFIINQKLDQIFFIFCFNMDVDGSQFKVSSNVQQLQLFGQLIVLECNDTSTLVGHFVSSPREREKRDRRESRKDGQGRKWNRHESEETDE